MKAPGSLCRLALFLFMIASSLIFLILSAPAQAVGQVEEAGGIESGVQGGEAAKALGGDSPDLQIGGLYGNFEIGRPSSIFVVLQNNAQPSESSDLAGGFIGPGGAGYDRRTARSIEAVLLSADDRIEILSSPQMAGLLAPGENVTVQFSALVRGAPLGIYPLALRLNYSRLSAAAASQEDGLTGFTFNYQRLTGELPLQAEVVQGPKMVLAETDVSAEAGGESKIRLTIENRGDEPAGRLKLEARPSPPFLMVENGEDEVRVAPGESAALAVSVFVDENAQSGYYALPCTITYRDGEEAVQDGWLAGLLHQTMGVILGAVPYGRSRLPEDGQGEVDNGNEKDEVGEEDDVSGQPWQAGEPRREELVALVYVGEEEWLAWLYPVGAGLVLLLALALAARWLMGKGRRVRIVRS